MFAFLQFEFELHPESELVFWVFGYLNFYGLRVGVVVVPAVESNGADMTVVECYFV